MDYAVFEQDVLDDVNESTYTDQVGDLNDDGIVLTIGETWQGTLYGLTERENGGRSIQVFNTEGAQSHWFWARSTLYGI